jgi:type II secretion system protein C
MNIYKLLATGVMLVAVLVALVYVGVARKLPRMPEARKQEPVALVWPSTLPVTDGVWQVFLNPQPAAAVPATGPLANRFRLAGTFFLYAAEGASAESQRRAILDDLRQNQQSIVTEGDMLDEYRVQHVFPDKVILQSAGVDYTLALSFADVAPTAPAAVAATGETAVVSMEDMPALESSRFGKRVGENRWVFKREELLKFYQEVLDEPQRIANVYLSLKPDYQGESIEGYRLANEGEADFFKAVGLQEGDTIRKVNSMRMVSQRRAEYFLSEFLKNRVSALVLDVEREGKPEKMIYLIR